MTWTNDTWALVVGLPTAGFVACVLVAALALFVNTGSQSHAEILTRLFIEWRKLRFEALERKTHAELQAKLMTRETELKASTETAILRARVTLVQDRLDRIIGASGPGGANPCNCPTCVAVRVS